MMGPSFLYRIFQKHSVPHLVIQFPRTSIAHASNLHSESRISGKKWEFSTHTKKQFQNDEFLLIYNLYRSSKYETKTKLQTNSNLMQT
jgi:hypothetical protein